MAKKKTSAEMAREQTEMAKVEGMLGDAFGMMGELEAPLEDKSIPQEENHQQAKDLPGDEIKPSGEQATDEFNKANADNKEDGVKQETQVEVEDGPLDSDSSASVMEEISPKSKPPKGPPVKGPPSKPPSSKPKNGSPNNGPASKSSSNKTPTDAASEKPLEREPSEMPASEEGSKDTQSKPPSGPPSQKAPTKPPSSKPKKGPPTKGPPTKGPPTKVSSKKASTDATDEKQSAREPSEMPPSEEAPKDSQSQPPSNKPPSGPPSQKPPAKPPKNSVSEPKSETPDTESMIKEPSKKPIKGPPNKAPPRMPPAILTNKSSEDDNQDEFDKVTQDSPVQDSTKKSNTEEDFAPNKTLNSSPSQSAEPVTKDLPNDKDADKVDQSIVDGDINDQNINYLVEKEAEIARLSAEVERLRSSMVGAADIIEELENPPMPPIVTEDLVIGDYIVADMARMARQLDRDELIRASMGSIAMLHPDRLEVLISTKHSAMLPRMNERDICASKLGGEPPRGAPEDWRVLEVLLASASLVTGGPAAVIHSYGPYTTAISCEKDLVLMQPLDEIGKQYIGKIIIVDPDPDNPEEFLRQVAEALQQGGMRCVVIRGSGAYAVGADLDQAWANAAMLEHSMKVVMLTRQANLKV